MGTISTRKRRDGTTAYLAQISIMKKGVIVHRENKTFDRKKAASDWVEMREAELKKRPELLGKSPKRNPTIGDAIDQYIADSKKAIGRTKEQVLRTIKTHDIADQQCDAISSRDVIEWLKDLNAKMSPQTAGNYMSHLGAVFTVARPAWGYPLDPTVMEDARIAAGRLGLVSKSRERDRRPTLEEIDRLMTHYFDRQARNPAMNPMTHIVAFAIFSTRRQEEIVTIKWDDFDEEGKRILVRDMKHPGEKAGNDTWCDLPERAISVIKAMPQTAPEIFPYSTDAVSASFTRACQFLAIEDLRFHDLRHDGVSRLFEMGMNIPHAAAVSGHRSWKSLQRYTHVRQTGDKYDGWRWMPTVSAPPNAKKPPAPEGTGG